MMASLIVGSSVARCAAATVTRTATRALSTSAALKKGQLIGPGMANRLGKSTYNFPDMKIKSDEFEMGTTSKGQAIL